MVRTTEITERDILKSLDEAIEAIRRQPQISPFGIEQELREKVLEPGGEKPFFEGEPPQIYLEVQRFYEGINHETNQLGALISLNNIRNNYQISENK
ncbi:hypothetical protein D6745_04270 [Candidatus Woesearchaeota archaeon]|nr:MAG: hypothetical protein D6745_04270 [Candidatus Woesearchaeota archaeon]